MVRVVQPAPMGESVKPELVLVRPISPCVMELVSISTLITTIAEVVGHNVVARRFAGTRFVSASPVCHPTLHVVVLV